MPFPRHWAVWIGLAVLAVMAGIGGYAFWSHCHLPAAGSRRYERYVDAFQVGLAALDTGVTQIAEENLTQAVDLARGEPAG